MTDAEKSIVRAEFAKDLIEVEMKKETLEAYLKSDMSLSPVEFNEKHGPDKDMEAFLADEFPK